MFNVFYSKPNDLFASIDAVFYTDYLEVAKKSRDNSLKYIKDIYGITPKKIETINHQKSEIMNINGFFKTKAFKITLR